MPTKANLNRGVPRPGADPRAEVRKSFADLWARLKQLIEFGGVATYLIYWDWKQPIRHSFKVGALSILTGSILILWIELATEASATLTSFRTGLIAAKPYLLLPFSIAVIYLGIHHLTERRHHYSEFVLGERIWLFMERRATLTTADEVVSTAAELFADVFKRFGIAHVSVFREADGQLTISARDVFPPEDDHDYFIHLKPGEGVAGLVHADLNPRYMPRLFFPVNREQFKFFPHAIKFELKRDSVDGFDLVNPTMDLNVFMPPPGQWRFRSFLSVPLRCIPREGERECFGVLNFDFRSTDPLDRADIKTAVLLGKLIGEELVRIERLNAGLHQVSP